MCEKSMEMGEEEKVLVRLHVVSGMVWNAKIVVEAARFKS